MESPSVSTIAGAEAEAEADADADADADVEAEADAAGDFDSFFPADAQAPPAIAAIDAAMNRARRARMESRALTSGRRSGR